MPISYTISESERLVHVQIVGRAEPSEYTALFTAVRDSQAATYGKLIDMRLAALDPSLGRIRSIAQATEVLPDQPRGAIAIVVGSEYGEFILEEFKRQVRPGFRFQSFRDEVKAKAWLVAEATK